MMAGTNLAKKSGLPMTDVGMMDRGKGAGISPQNLGEVVKFAEVMARAGIALPAHLRDQPGACMAVALQAMEWELSPFAVASKSYAVKGVIAYEAQLIAAVVNTRSGIKGRLKYAYSGEGETLVCTVSGVLGDEICEYESPPISSITTKNSPLWKTDPKQQLGYYSARAWARRYCPEVILGAYDRDEAQEMKDVTPAGGTGLAARLSGPEGGFDADTIETTLDDADNQDTPAEGTEPPESEEPSSADTSEPTQGDFDLQQQFENPDPNAAFDRMEAEASSS